MSLGPIFNRAMQDSLKSREETIGDQEAKIKALTEEMTKVLQSNERVFEI